MGGFAALINSERFTSSADWAAPLRFSLTTIPQRGLSFEDGGSGGHHLAADSGVAIAWYCVLVVVTTVVGACLCVKLRNCQRNRRYLEEEEEETERQGQIDIEIARIEANVKVFEEKQEILKKKQLQKVMNDQIVVVTETDLGEHKKGVVKYNFGEGCSICIESFRAGDRVAHSVETKPEADACPHLFHENCIISWFVSRPEERCPVCRRQFANLSSLEELTHPRSRQSTAETQLFPPESPSSRSRQSTPERLDFPQLAENPEDPLALTSTTTSVGENNV